MPNRIAASEATVDAAVAEHGREAAAIPVLQTVQVANGSFLSKNVLGAVAHALQLHDAGIYGVASFYSLFSTQARSAKVIHVCDGPACMLHGAASVRASIEAAAFGDEWATERCSCLGLCDRAPAVLRRGEPCGPVPLERAAAVLSGDLCTATPSYAKPLPGEVRVAMARIGRVDPESVESAIDAGAYQALHGALGATPADVLDAVDCSGLRGCGGGRLPDRPQVAHGRPDWRPK